MPKSVKKPCTTQTSISRYFGGLSSSSSSSSSSRSRPQCGIKPNPAEQRSKGKIKLSSGDGDGLPSKRAKLAETDQQVEDLECEPTSSQRIKEPKPTVSRGGLVCSSTLEKLKGFSCMAEPLVLHTQDKTKTDDHSGESSDKRSTVSATFGSLQKQITDTLPQTLEDRGDEAQSNKKEEDPELAATSRVHTTFSSM